MDQDKLAAIITRARNNRTTVLSLGGADLESLPAEIGDLTGLTELDLRYNQLTALPPEIGNLTNLTRLDLAFNRLSAMPPRDWRTDRLHQA